MDKRKNTLTKKWIKGKVIHNQIIYNSGFQGTRVEILLDVNGKEISINDKNLSKYGSSPKEVEERLKAGTTLELLVDRRFKLFNNSCFNWYKENFGSLGFNVGKVRYYYSHKVHEAIF